MLNTINHQENANKTIIRYQYIPITVCAVKRLTYRVLAREQLLGLSHTAGGNIKWVNFRKQFNSCIDNETCTCYVTHSTPMYRPKEIKACVHTKTCTINVLMAAFLYQPRPENNVIIHQQVNEHTMVQSLLIMLRITAKQ